ncbi:MAG TPA: carbonic anhydrase [Gemmataceae bacterium]|nr:carbonic anhydrase [Gemmataceae bacterium]
MFEIVYQFDPDGRHTPDAPADPTGARLRLEAGNHEFAVLHDPRAAGGVGRRVVRFDADDLGLPNPDGSAPTQRPFAAVLGCADARVPTEMVFGQNTNDLFVVRVAGNVLGDECLGSLDYALAHLGEGLKLVVVLGHSRCGAVSAAVDAFLDPTRYLAVAHSHPLRAVVDRILVAVRAAQRAMEESWGPGVTDRPRYRRALIETAVGLNAAMTAATICQEFRDQLGPHRQVLYGVYDLVSREVGLPVGVPGESRFTPGLAAPPSDLSGFAQLGVLFATSPATRDLLAAG